jgi:hypothetical protein
MKSFVKNSLSLSAGALALAFAASGSSAFAATPIKGCGLLSSPGAYVLANDIINPAMPSTGGFCIFATVDRVTLDLAGHTIHSSGHTGSAIAGEKSFVVRNGTIEGFQFAVDAANNATVENLVIDSVAATAIDVIDGRIEGNTIIKADTGIVASGPSIIARNFMKDMRVGMFIGDVANSASIVRDNVILPSGSGISGGSAADAEIGLIADNTIRIPNPTAQTNSAIFLNPCVGALVTANMVNQFPATANFDASCQVVGNVVDSVAGALRTPESVAGALGTRK